MVNTKNRKIDFKILTCHSTLPWSVKNNITISVCNFHHAFCIHWHHIVSHKSLILTVWMTSNVNEIQFNETACYERFFFFFLIFQKGLPKLARFTGTDAFCIVAPNATRNAWFSYVCTLFCVVRSVLLVPRTTSCHVTNHTIIVVLDVPVRNFNTFTYL